MTSTYTLGNQSSQRRVCMKQCAEHCGKHENTCTENNVKVNLQQNYQQLGGTVGKFQSSDLSDPSRPSHLTRQTTGDALTHSRPICYTANQKPKSFLSHKGSLGSADLRFNSPQPDTCRSCKSTDTGLVSRVGCLFSSQLVLVPIYCLVNRGTCVNNLPKVEREALRPEIEPVTSRLQVWRPNHYATTSHKQTVWLHCQTLLIQGKQTIVYTWNSYILSDNIALI